MKKKIIPYFVKLLKLYGDKFFESKLKNCLLEIQPRKELLPYIIKALESSLKNERYYQASQLLPVIAKYNKSLVQIYVNQFIPLVALDDRIQYR
jgi:hypothetical protein